ncbi:hypothetical protein K461DRAFT_113131 [Myriangium duriaei CBS 260.36]|uniref:Uncharacterized protein n=1 Tax=Myriangium duriaei CBS 260.36 TaxID=1168546 RepID=A0A9P4MI02_9PEZI|nr:hypothetical protein K461DRAFT_113131 [Myriangium duriaei CBS 260.36]
MLCRICPLHPLQPRHSMTGRTNATYLYTTVARNEIAFTLGSRDASGLDRIHANCLGSSLTDAHLRPQQTRCCAPELTVRPADRHKSRRLGTTLDQEPHGSTQRIAGDVWMHWVVQQRAYTGQRQIKRACEVSSDDRAGLELQLEPAEMMIGRCARQRLIRG